MIHCAASDADIRKFNTEKPSDQQYEESVLNGVCFLFFFVKTLDVLIYYVAMLLKLHFNTFAACI